MRFADARKKRRLAFRRSLSLLVLAVLDLLGLRGLLGFPAFLELVLELLRVRVGNRGSGRRSRSRVLALSRMTNKRNRVARADEGKLARVGTWGSRKSQARGWGRVRTFAAAWKLFTVFPRLLPSSGSLLGPKSTAATPPMTTSSGRPRPNRPIVATDLLPAPRAPPAVTMPALSAEGLPRNAGADPVRPDMAHDLGACALGAEALPRASPGRTTVAVVGREAMTILFRRGHGKVCYPRGRTNAATCAAARSTAGPGTGVSYCSRARRCVRSGARSRQRLAERPSPDAPDQPSASISENSLAGGFRAQPKSGPYYFTAAYYRNARAAARSSASDGRGRCGS